MISFKKAFIITLCVLGGYAILSICFYRLLNRQLYSEFQEFAAFYLSIFFFGNASMLIIISVPVLLIYCFILVRKRQRDKAKTTAFVTAILLISLLFCLLNWKITEIRSYRDSVDRLKTFSKSITDVQGHWGPDHIYAFKTDKLDCDKVILLCSHRYGYGIFIYNDMKISRCFIWADPDYKYRYDIFYMIDGRTFEWNEVEPEGTLPEYRKFIAGINRSLTPDEKAQLLEISKFLDVEFKNFSTYPQIPLRKGMMDRRMILNTAHIVKGKIDEVLGLARPADSIRPYM